MQRPINQIFGLKTEANLTNDTRQTLFFGLHKEMNYEEFMSGAKCTKLTEISFFARMSEEKMVLFSNVLKTNNSLVRLSLQSKYAV